MVVAGEETVERGLRVPLELQQFPAGLELQGEAPTIVDVRVRGASGTLSRVAPGDVVAVLDLRGARPGRRLFQLTPEQVRAPFGVRGRPGHAAEPSRWCSRPRRRARCRSCPPSKASRRRVTSSARSTVEPPTVEVVGPESAVKQRDRSADRAGLGRRRARAR